MDVIFETPSGRQFTIEVWYFATVLEMKENIQKYQGIPVSKQTLVFNGQVMADNRDTEYYNVFQGSCIQLIVEDEPGKPEEPIQVQILIKVPISKKQFPLELSITDTVARLKERIHEVEGIPVSRLVLIFENSELQDHRTLSEYEIHTGSEVNVIVKSFPLASASSGMKKLRVMVLPQSGNKKIPVEVNAADNVSELRKELQRLHNHHHFHLPSDYFFIYKQNVMDEDHNFRWHDVRHGDTIEIFNGSVTGGGS